MCSNSNLMHCQECKQEVEISHYSPYLAFLKPHLGYCAWLGSPSTRVTLTNWTESGQEGCYSWRPIICRESLRELVLFSQEKGKGQSGSQQFPTLQRNTEQPGRDTSQRHAVDTQEATVTSHSKGNSSWAQRNSKFRSIINIATQPQKDGEISTLADPKLTWTIPWAIGSDFEGALLWEATEVRWSAELFSDWFFSKTAKIKREIIILMD